MQETERKPMKKDWEIYRDTGILGGYMPECAKLRQTEDGDVATVFRDTTTCMEEDCITKQREMLIGGRRFCITSVFPAEPSATPTDKLIDCLSLLEQAEQLLIRDLFYNGLTERDAAQKYGVSQVAIHKRKLRILKKLKNMMT